MHINVDRISMMWLKTKDVGPVIGKHKTRGAKLNVTRNIRKQLAQLLSMLYSIMDTIFEKQGHIS